MLVHGLTLKPGTLTDCWIGWRVERPRRGAYLETRVTVTDLTTLGGRVYVDARRVR